ncbi:MAG: hypothetical protein MZW92_27265 [Comamonadaceae bacterium]|nr:hypothetical protein [Comamonadaceae bacterium]
MIAGDARGLDAASTPLTQPREDRRDHRQQVLRQHRRRRDRGPHARPLRQRPRQEVGGPELHEVLQRRRGELPLPLATACGSSPSTSAGACSRKTPTTSRWPRQVNQHRASTSRPPRAAKVPRAGKRPCARSKLIDGVVWDGKDPAKPTPAASRSRR